MRFMDVIDKVQQLLGQKKIEAARELLEENKSELNYDDYYAYSGLCYEMGTQYDMALKEYYKIQYVGERINSKFYHFHIAVCLNSLGKPKQALANLVEIEHYLSKKEVSLHFQFYVSYNMLGEEEKALKHIRAICKVNKAPFYQLRYANLLNNLGFCKEAYQIESKFYKKYSEDPFLVRELSSSTYNLQNYKEAKIYLEKLIELKAAADWDYIYLANIYIFSEEYPEAFKMLDCVQKKDAYTYTKYAYCYGKLGNEKKAVSYYEKAITEDAKNILGIVSYVSYYRSLQKYEEAILVLQRYQKKNPEYKGRVLYEMAKVESDRDNYKKACFYLKKAEKVEDHPLIFCDLAWNYKQLEKFEDELVYLRKAEESLLEDSWVFMELGSCLLQLNSFKEALSYFEKVNLGNLEMDLDRYSYEVGFCYEMLGDFEVAKSFFERVENKEAYTFGHLIRCCYALDEVDQVLNWANQIDFQKAEDPWFLELYLDVLIVQRQYSVMLSFLEEQKKKIPRLLYFKKKVEGLCYLSKNKNDLNLERAFKVQQQVERLEKETKETLLWRGILFNRLHDQKQAEEFLKRSREAGEKGYLLKREEIYNLYLLSNQDQLKQALDRSKNLYHDYGKEEALFLIAFGEYRLKHYLRSIFVLRGLKSQFLEKEMFILKAICFYKMGRKRYGKKLLQPWISQSERFEFLEEFLKEVHWT